MKSLPDFNHIPRNITCLSLYDFNIIQVTDYLLGGVFLMTSHSSSFLYWGTGIVTLPLQWAHKSKSCEENRYWLYSYSCRCAFSSQLSVINQSKLRELQAFQIIPLMWRSSAAVHSAGKKVLPQLQPVKRHIATAKIWVSMQFISIVFGLFCWQAYISNNSLYIADRPVTAVYHWNS